MPNTVPNNLDAAHLDSLLLSHCLDGNLIMIIDLRIVSEDNSHGKILFHSFPQHLSLKLIFVFSER